MADAAGERAGGSDANKARVAKAQQDAMDDAEVRGAKYEKRAIKTAISNDSDAYLAVALEMQEQTTAQVER